MKKIRFYISGPMTGIPNSNFPSFDKAKAKLERMGFEVVSPADLDRQRGKMSYHDMLLDDIRYLLSCHYVYVLKGHQNSFGCKMEILVAQAAKMEIFYE